MTDLQFRSFLILAEELNFTKASKRLNISQSTLSSHISSLEKNLGVTLFVRNNKNVELSPEGLHLYPFFSQAFEMIDRGVEEARAIHEGHVDVLRVGLINGLSTDFMQQVKDILDDFCRLYPETKLEMLATNEKEMVDMLESHKIDLVFTIEGIVKIKPEYMMFPIAKNPIGIIYMADKFNDVADISVKTFEKETMIVMSKEIAPSEEFFLREFQEKMGIKFKNVMRVNSNEARLFHIFSGKGIGFCDAMTKFPYDIPMHRFFVDDFYVRYGFVCREDVNNHLVQEFFEFLKKKYIMIDEAAVCL